MKPRVFAYMQDWIPCRNGSGTNNRIFSNVRAYSDNGYDVEIVCFRTRDDWRFEPDSSLGRVTWTEVRLAVDRKGQVGERMAYWLGWPLGAGLDYRFKTRAAICREVVKREQKHPGSWHHLEYIACANAAISLPGIACAWSHHDMESDFAEGHLRMRSELTTKSPGSADRRGLRWLKRAERLAAQRCAAVFCIARHETEKIRKEWGCENAVFFPMSLPDESPPARTRGWLQGGRLKMFHLGRIDSLPSFRSLEFLLKDVFPVLDKATRSSIELVVVGEVRETDRARQLINLANNFPEVRLLGFQGDIRRFYGEADLQVVGSSEATGLRTRIVESFAYGVPVLSTTIGAKGVDGLNAGRNILIADTPENFATELRQLVEHPARLAVLADNARATYQTNYSRPAVARRLQELLGNYWPKA